MSVTDKTFSETFSNSLEILAVVQALAAMDGFVSLQRLCERQPTIVARYCDIAIAAIRALNRLHRARARDKNR